MTIMIGVIQRGKLEKLMPDLLRLERNWVQVGEVPWSSENFKVDLPGKWKLSLYASYKKRIVGYAICSIEGHVGRLNKILVDQELRNKGIGTRLWNEMLKRCRQLGLNRLEFKSALDNPAAISFYKKKGCLFSGRAMGCDGKVRNTNMYILKAKNPISHSMPTIGDLDIKSVSELIGSSSIATGNTVDKLSSVICSYTRRRAAIATSSCTSALHLGLRTLGIGKGDEVILPSFLCYSVLSAVLQTGASPVLVDINENDFNISYESTSACITKQTKAIIVPHLFGTPVSNIDNFTSLGIPVIEDCAQSLGADHNEKKVGSFGTMSAFSFYATKMIAGGVGGMLALDDESLISKAKDLVMADKRETFGECYNTRMSDIQAALALSQMQRIDLFVRRRRYIAEKYTQLFERGEVDFNIPNPAESIFYRYIIRHALKDYFIRSVNARGLGCAEPIYKPLHRYLGLADSKFPNTSKAFGEAVSIPIYPGLSDEQVLESAGIILNWRQEVRK